MINNCIWGEDMSTKDISGLIIALWFALHLFRSQDAFYVFPAKLISKKWKDRCLYTYFNEIYKFIYLKKYRENNIDFITKIKVKLNTYINIMNIETKVY